MKRSKGKFLSSLAINNGVIFSNVIIKLVFEVEYFLIVSIRSLIIAN